MFQVSTLVRALALAGAVSLAGTAQANIVSNGGFETGNFSGWTQFGSTGFFDSVNNSPVNVQAGNFGSSFGNVGSVSGIFQTLATTAGASYQISFWLKNRSSATPNEMAFNWNGGAAELSFTNGAVFGFTNYNFLLAATGAATDLRFGFRHDPSFWALDSVSVVRVPEPGSLALVGLALAGLALSARRKQA